MGIFDTVVVSEVAYFLARAEWAATLERTRPTLAADGVLVLVHWPHPLIDLPLDTDTAHRMAAALPGLETVVHHVEPDVEVVMRPRGLPSVAEEEGRT